MTALQIDDLHLAYGSQPVLRGVALTIAAGELVGLVGPNGSGKSSLMRAIAGLQPFQRGRIVIAGVDVASDPQAARQPLGYACDPATLPPRLTGRQCVELVADLRHAPEALPASWALADALGLAAWLDRMVGGYSLGTRQKLAVVIALFGDPALLVLDEVLNGLDPLAAWALKCELQRRAANGAAVLLATHGLEVAERFLDRAVLLLDGRLAADWSRDALAAFRNDPRGGLEHAVVERLRAYAGAGNGEPLTAR